MAVIRYLVPYQLDVIARDLTSNKPIQNTFYLKTGIQSVSPPSYGAPIAGGGNQNTLLASFVANWEANIMPLLSVKYVTPTYRIRAILGKQYASPVLPIAGLVPGNPVSVSTSGPHNLSTGNTVFLAGVGTPGTVNGNWVITVLSPTTFTLDGSNIAGSWSNNGIVQMVTGRLQFLYDDLAETNTGAVGGIAGDALPSFCSVDVRRINSYTGRHFRSRWGMGIIGEADQLNGTLTGAAITALVAALGPTTFNAGYPNGGTDSGGSGDSRHYVVSRAVALSQASPFTVSNTFSAPVDQFIFRARLGSQVSRKGRLV